MKYINTEIIVDDNTIDTLGPMEAIEPLWTTMYSVNDHEEYVKEIKKWNEEQVNIYAIERYMAEVMNGGHCQFYFNSAGESWEEAVRGLNAVGMNDLADNLLRSSKVNGKNFSKDIETRREELDSADEELMSECDTYFYDREKQLYDHVMSYIKSRRDKFYYKGVMKAPSFNINI